MSQSTKDRLSIVQDSTEFGVGSKNKHYQKLIETLHSEIDAELIPPIQNYLEHWIPRDGFEPASERTFWPIELLQAKRTEYLEDDTTRMEPPVFLIGAIQWDHLLGIEHETGKFIEYHLTLSYYEWEPEDIETRYSSFEAFVKFLQEEYFGA